MSYISVLLPSNIIEKIIHNRSIHHLEINYFLDVYQEVFRTKNNLTINTAVRLTNDIFNAINYRTTTVATFVDVAKALIQLIIKILWLMESLLSQEIYPVAFLKGALLVHCYLYYV